MFGESRICGGFLTLWWSSFRTVSCSTLFERFFGVVRLFVTVGLGTVTGVV